MTRRRSILFGPALVVPAAALAIAGCGGYSNANNVKAPGRDDHVDEARERRRRPRCRPARSSRVAPAVVALPDLESVST